MRTLASVIHGPDFGGAHNQLLRLAGPLRERGFETVAVLSEEADDPAARFRDAGVETHQLPLGRLRASPDPRLQLRFARSFRADLKRLRSLNRAVGADVVQAHGPTNPQAALAASGDGVAVVHQILDTRAPMALRRMTMPVMVRTADVITCWGRELARVHPGAEGLEERLICVFPPVDSRTLAPSVEERGAARERLRVPADALVMGTLAVRNPQKGIEWLIRAAQIVVGRHADAVVRIIGTESTAHAEYEAALRSEASSLGLDPPRLEFIDPGTDAHLLLQGLDLFVLSSVPRSEGVPTAILEAMALGKPVVATDVGAVREIVDDGATGLVVAAEDPSAIADAASALLADGARMDAFGAAGRSAATERFDIEHLADLHARAYDLAISHRAARGRGSAT